jgi:hypothetical protein
MHGGIVESLSISLTDQGFGRDAVANAIEHERRRLACEASAKLQQLESWLVQTLSGDDPLGAECLSLGHCNKSKPTGPGAPQRALGIHNQSIQSMDIYNGNNC